MSKHISKILIIQTAFIGDVILATPVIEAISNANPSIKIDMLIRNSNRGILTDHPKINKLWLWNKSESKLMNQLKLIAEFRKQKYDVIINLQRFMSSGIFTAFSGAKQRIGFDKNPLSFTFSTKVPHIIKKGIHEVDRNLDLVKSIFPEANASMKLYPSKEDFEAVENYKSEKYIVLAPTSVWFTKQYPAHKWVEFINQVNDDIDIYMIGGPDDSDAINSIIKVANNKKTVNLCGKLTILQSAALMKDALMNYVNDSAPQHMASAMNAPCTAIFCSTVTSFGFGPKSDNSVVVECAEQLDCKPCGLHGRVECKEGHFNCANLISTNSLLERIQ